ncbi:hypothetical protein ACH5RR_012385 [Cinchona calisaya]|uniref:Uncharacterized protein n=1 Tax=Cinchona calisaya TaxID=153742 RepID=A0ABD3A7K7_9GENT
MAKTLNGFFQSNVGIPDLQVAHPMRKAIEANAFSTKNGLEEIYFNFVRKNWLSLLENKETIYENKGQETGKNENVPRIEAIAVNDEVVGTQAPVEWITELVAVNKRLLKFERKIKKWMSRKETRLQRIELNIHYLVTQINDSVNDESYQFGTDDKDEHGDHFTEYLDE